MSSVSLPPVIVAQTWESLSLLAPGKVFRGVGLGENLNEGAAGGGWAEYSERFCRVQEAVRIIWMLWSGDYVQLKGQTWSIDGKLYDPLVSSTPLYIAATTGIQSARLSGLTGDGLITAGKLLKSNAALKSAWDEGVNEAGGDPQTKSILGSIGQ